jgi:hypothetical protein
LFSVTALRYVGLTTLALAELWIIGQPLRVVVDAAAGTRVRVLPTPVLGIITAVVAGWYWYRYVGPLAGFMRALLILGLVILTIRAIWLWRGNTRGAVSRLQPTAATTTAATVALGLGLVVFVAYGWLSAQGHQTVASYGNADISQYVTYGQQILDHPADDRGNIAGFDLGRTVDNSGTFGWAGCALIAAASSGPITDAWLLAEPMLFLVAGLVGLVIALTALEILGTGRWLAAAVGVLACTTGVFGYVVSQGFLGQLTALVLTLTGVAQLWFAITVNDRRRRLVHAAIAGACIATGIAGYPHMTLLGTAMLLPPLLIAVWSTAGSRADRAIKTVVVRVATAAAVSAVTVLVLIPEIIVRLPDTLRFLSNAQAGWPLRVLMPTEVFGLVPSSWSHVPPDSNHPVFSPVGPGSRAFNVAFLAMLVAVAVFLWWRRQRAVVISSLLTIAVILVPYYALYNLVWGASYRQWKFVSFFAPSYVAACFLLLGAAAAAVPRLAGSSARWLLPSAACLALLGSMLEFTMPTSAPPITSVTLDQIDLETDSRLASMQALNVDVAGVWDSIWVAYFLRDKQLYIQSPSTFVIAPPAAEWTLTRADQVPAVELSDGTYVPINATYGLVPATVGGAAGGG